jgi:hypothetical protein
MFFFKWVTKIWGVTFLVVPPKDKFALDGKCNKLIAFIEFNKAKLYHNKVRGTNHGLRPT